MEKISRRHLLGGAIGAFVAAQSKAGDALRSPWDAQTVSPSETPYSCPAPTPVGPDLTADGFYADAQFSVPDPAKLKAYRDAVAPVRANGDAVVAAADAYRTTGSLAAARCGARILTDNASSKALTGVMSSVQAHYVQGWILGGEALAYLKLRKSGVVTREHAEAKGSKVFSLLNPTEQEPISAEEINAFCVLLRERFTQSRQ